MHQVSWDAERARQSFLAQIERWDFPATDWEAQVIRDIGRLPHVLATRDDPNALARMGMRQNECHKNAQTMAKRDRGGTTRCVTGWWNHGGNYVVHSVIERDGRFLCVTPTPLHGQTPIEFVPDPRIEWRADGGKFLKAFRDGMRIGPGVRSDPQKELEALEAMRQRLLSGMNPYEAVQVEPPAKR